MVFVFCYLNNDGFVFFWEKKDKYNITTLYDNYYYYYNYNVTYHYSCICFRSREYSMMLFANKLG